jgi:SAM-dependent methyltransferase
MTPAQPRTSTPQLHPHVAAWAAAAVPCWSGWRAWVTGSSPAWTSAHRLPRRRSAEVIEHIEKLGLFLAELARLLRPGGLALFTTPNLHSAQAKLLFALGDRLKQFDAKG